MTFEIRTLKDDELITEPGFYAISMDRHHNQPCDGPSVTSGVLRKMELASPADVWAFSKLNPDRWEQEDTTALRLGRAMAAYVEGGEDEVRNHFMVLGEDTPRRPTALQLKNYVDGGWNNLHGFKVIPEGAPRKPTQKQYEAMTSGKASNAAMASIEFWEAFLADGKRPVSARDFEGIKATVKQIEFWQKIEADHRDLVTDAEWKMISDMGRVLASDAGACAVMGGVPELTMAWQDERTGLWFLARPDNITMDGVVSDYKKINTQGRPFNTSVIDNRITQHGYDMQMAFAAEVFENLTGEWPDAAIVGQWDKPPHHVIVREIEDEDLRFGQFRNRRAARLFSECLASGNWPGPGEHVGAYRRPDWLRERLIEEMAVEGTSP